MSNLQIFLVFKDYKVKVSDFGLASVKLESSRQSTQQLGIITGRGTPIGTLRWKAPEALRIGVKPNEKMDVFSFGVVLWELATRQEPWAGVDESEVRKRVLAGERLSLKNDSIPSAFVELIQWCWTQDPHKRPGFTEVVQSLNAVIQKQEASESN